jgi:DNA (cytosine-5)-methyltransferase 1
VSVYYNEIDPYAAQWLRNLIAADLIAPGEVDERSIEDVKPDDLRGFVQCHFFAGIGGWAYALDLAGWPRDRPVWTGSCPCQSFSQAGKGLGFEDERHLWPAWQHLIAQCTPATLFGEQVASKGADAWVDLVHADLEGMGYAFGCVPFPAAGIGAPHIRDRNYWVAYASNSRLQECERNGGVPGRTIRAIEGQAVERDSVRTVVGLGDTDSNGTRRNGAAIHRSQAGEGGRRCGNDADASGAADRPVATNGFWRDADWLGCRDGKWRPVEPGTFPLAHGIPGRVGKLRGYGNAIVPQAAAAFVRAYLETQQAVMSEAA